MDNILDTILGIASTAVRTMFPAVTGAFEIAKKTLLRVNQIVKDADGRSFTTAEREELAQIVSDAESTFDAITVKIEAKRAAAFDEATPE